MEPGYHSSIQFPPWISTWVIFSCLLRHIGRKLDERWKSQDLKQFSDTECQHSRQQPMSLCRSARPYERKFLTVVTIFFFKSLEWSSLCGYGFKLQINEFLLLIKGSLKDRRVGGAESEWLTSNLQRQQTQCAHAWASFHGWATRMRRWPQEEEAYSGGWSWGWVSWSTGRKTLLLDFQPDNFNVTWLTSVWKLIKS